MSYVNKNDAFGRVLACLATAAGTVCCAAGLGIWSLLAALLLPFVLGPFNRGLETNRGPRRRPR